MAVRETSVLTWEVLMNYLRWVGLMPSLLIVGVLGGWLVPLPSEALNSIPPTVTIDGVRIDFTGKRIANVNNACPPPDTAYNSCWSIPTGPYNGWTVGHYNATSNKARVLINDASAAGSRDSMKMTGITFTKTGGQIGVTYVTHAIITHLFNEGGGNISGDYLWALAQGGQFDPPSNENVVGNRLKLTGTGTAGTSFPLGVLDTGNFTTSTINNVIGYVTKSKAASVVKPACNTGSGRCAPTIKYDYEITVKGADQLQLSDSVFGAGGVCYKGLKLKLLKLIDHIFDHFDHLADAEHPMGCTKFAENLNTEVQAAVAAIVAEGEAVGGVAVETCEGACIVINKTVDPDLNTGEDTVTFGFTGTGPGLNNFTLTTDEIGGESTTFSGLVAGASGWTITETGFPYVVDPDGDFDMFWWTRTVSCESKNNPASGNTSGPTTWTTFAPTFNTVQPPSHELGKPVTEIDPEIAPLRQGYVTVTNLAAGDTLTCNFVNRLFNDDVSNNDPNPPDID
jgi:hypothetical protein